MDAPPRYLTDATCASPSLDGPFWRIRGSGESKDGTMSKDGKRAAWSRTSFRSHDSEQGALDTLTALKAAHPGYDTWTLIRFESWILTFETEV